MKKKVTAVLVGCGNISQVWLSAIQDIPGIKIVGLVDVKKEKAQFIAKKFGLGDRIETDLSASLQQNLPDVVFDCTTPDARIEIISTALEYGCHVLVEKPLANTVAEAKKIISMAEEANRICAIIQNHRYDPGIRRLSKFLKSGALGELTFCNTNFFIGSRFEGFRSHMKHVLLQDMAIHTFDSVRAVLEADPVSVYCNEWNPRGSWYDHDASAVAIFEFSNNIIYTYQGSWCSQGLRTQWASEWRINGTRGSLSWDGQKKFNVQALSCENEIKLPLTDLSIPDIDASDKTGGHSGLIADFVDCIRTKRQPETVCNDNIKSLQMVYAAIESSNLGEKVCII